MSENDKKTAAPLSVKDAMEWALLFGVLALAVYTPLLGKAYGAIYSGFFGSINGVEALSKALGPQWTGFLFFGIALSSACVLTKSKNETLAGGSVLLLCCCFVVFMLRMCSLSPSNYDGFLENKRLHALSSTEVQALIAKYPDEVAYVDGQSPQKIASGKFSERFLVTPCQAFQKKFLAHSEWSDRYVVFVNGQRLSDKALPCRFWSNNSVLVTYTPTYAPNGLVAILDRQAKNR